MRDRQETNEANRGDTVGPDDVRPTSLVLVGIYSNKWSTNNSECVDWYRQELRVGFGVPKPEDDARCSRCKSIDGNGVALISCQTRHIDKTTKKYLPSRQ
jgi:hypothetical protein